MTAAARGVRMLALLVASAPAAAVAASVGLRLNVVSNVKQSYADHGSGASMDLFTWQPSCGPDTEAPKCEEPWFSLGHVATSSAGKGITAIVALAGPDDPLALAKPTALALNWNTLLGGKSHGTSGGVWTPVCPTGYRALGSVAIEHDIAKPHEITPALFPTLRCLKVKYLKPGGELTLLWDSKPTHYDTPCSVWTQPPEAHQQHPDDVVLTLPMIGGQRSFSAPTNASFQIDFTAGVEVVVPPPPPCGSPPLPACPPCGDEGTGLPPCVCPAPKPGPPPPCAAAAAAAKPPPPCVPPLCEPSRFLGVDNTTQGDWQSKYGKAGFHMFGGLGGYNASANLPSFIKSVTILPPGAAAAPAGGGGGPPGPPPAPCPSSAPGFTNCSAMSFKDMCLAADTPGCCHWCDSNSDTSSEEEASMHAAGYATGSGGGGGVCVQHGAACPGAAGSGSTSLLPAARHGRWSTMPTALDPRALVFPSAGVYKALGFVATTAPASSNASFQVSIEYDNNVMLQQRRQQQQQATRRGSTLAASAAAAVRDSYVL
eukprot:COSAG06_NODE_1768_length_8432_cov_5.547822_6_plen_542_part_00